jgi:hypothetical protein
LLCRRNSRRCRAPVPSCRRCSWSRDEPAISAGPSGPMILAARGRRIDPGPAIRSADRAAGILPLAKVRWRRAARWARTAGAGRAIMAEVLQYQRFRPAGFRNGRPARWRSTAFRDGWIAWRRRASRNAAAPRNAVLPWEAGGPAERRFAVGGSGKSVARCRRTVLVYWKLVTATLWSTH